jgi:hypothetical protein
MRRSGASNQTDGSLSNKPLKADGRLVATCTAALSPVVKNQRYVDMERRFKF